MWVLWGMLRCTRDAAAALTGEQEAQLAPYRQATRVVLASQAPHGCKATQQQIATFLTSSTGCGQPALPAGIHASGG